MLDEDVDIIFINADIDGNGFINYHEFIAATMNLKDKYS
jgi:hypothetical protein